MGILSVEHAKQLLTPESIPAELYPVDGLVFQENIDMYFIHLANEDIDPTGWELGDLFKDFKAWAEDDVVDELACAYGGIDPSTVSEQRIHALKSAAAWSYLSARANNEGGDNEGS